MGFLNFGHESWPEIQALYIMFGMEWEGDEENSITAPIFRHKFQSWIYLFSCCKCLEFIYYIWCNFIKQMPSLLSQNRGGREMSPNEQHTQIQLI